MNYDFKYRKSLHFYIRCKNLYFLSIICRYLKKTRFYVIILCTIYSKGGVRMKTIRNILIMLLGFAIFDHRVVRMIQMAMYGFLELSFPMMLLVIACLTVVAFGLGALLKKLFSKHR